MNTRSKPQKRSVQRPSCTFRMNAIASDCEAVRDIVASTGFFSATEVEIAVELINDRLTRGEQSDYRFVFADLNGSPVGYACYGHIAGTQGSFDLYWIAVHENHRGKGIGQRLLAQTERRIASEGGSRIYVETSSREQYEPTRKFYLRCGYKNDALLEDYYSPGDGKIILVKVVE